MPWIIVPATLRPRERVGRADPAHHLRVAALEDAVLGPRARDSPSPHATSTHGTFRARCVPAHPVRVRVPGEVAGDAFATSTTSSSATLPSRAIDVVRDRRRGGVEVPHRVVAEHEHRVGRRGPRARRATRPARRAARPRRGRAQWCRAPRASRRGARPRTAHPRLPASGRSSRRGCRARGACAGRGRRRWRGTPRTARAARGR